MASHTRHHVDKKIAKLIEQAVAEIAEHGHREIYVSVQRAKRKMYSMKMTDRQIWLYRYIQKRGFISKEEALGMNWNVLGGLRNRGFVENAEQGGREGLRATRPSY